ncbi:hypothetical protein S40293_02799 [Stachybotrys chartarum IBT 40293]|nr:hypothetical protein S40293_02799 [Stachybotrys chartarum IBT 40293]
MSTNGQNSMLPLQQLLNPDFSAPHELPLDESTRLQPNIAPPKEEPPATRSVSLLKMKKAKDSSGISKSGPRGPVNYPPFETLDDASLQQVARFDVTPFGQIHQGYEHFPYNSEKRDLLEKTGRESIEAFMYEFKVPGNASSQVVMWDYNIGIVRLASLFRLCGFNKTGPAQTFSKNPGLLALTPNITGGAVPAQGYWFPYRCAKAICAKFCHHIAGALIPLFGPGFPAECTPPDSPRYRRLDISQQVLAEAAQESVVYRRIYLSRNIKVGDSLMPQLRTERLSFLRGSHIPEQNEKARFQEPPIVQFASRAGHSRRLHPLGRPSILSPQVSEEFRRQNFTAADTPAEERGYLRQTYHFPDPTLQAPAEEEVKHTSGHKRRRIGDTRNEVADEQTRPLAVVAEDQQKPGKEGKSKADYEQYGAAMVLVSIRQGSTWPDTISVPESGRGGFSLRHRAHERAS